MVAGDRDRATRSPAPVPPSSTQPRSRPPCTARNPRLRGSPNRNGTDDSATTLRARKSREPASTSDTHTAPIPPPRPRTRGHGVDRLTWGLPFPHRPESTGATPVVAMRDFSITTGFRVPGSGFGVPGSGFRVPGSGFRVPGSGFREESATRSAHGSEPWAESDENPCGVGVARRGTRCRRHVRLP